MLEQTEEQKPSFIAMESGDSPKPREQRGAKKKTGSLALKGWGLAILVAQVVTLALVYWHGRALVARIETARSELLQESAVHHADIAKLGETNGLLTSDVRDLRDLVSSKTDEDILFLKIMIINSDIEPEIAKTIARNVRHYGSFYGQDPDLVLALMAIESNFDPDAVSHKGATGLMQIMPHWKRVLGITGDLKDPETSIKYGLQILGFYKEMYGETEIALTAYNRGPGPVDGALVNGRDFRNGYSDKVLKMYDRLKDLSAGGL